MKENFVKYDESAHFPKNDDSISKATNARLKSSFSGVKEIYVYKEDGDTFFTLNKKLDEAAKEAGFVLSSKKKRALYYECEKNGVVAVKSELKTPKLVTKTSLSLDDSTLDKLLKKKIDKNLSSYEKVILDCIDKVDAIEKMVIDCSGDDCDNKKLHESLYELFFGEKR